MRSFILAALLCLLPSVALAEFTVDSRSALHFGCSAAFGAAADTFAYHGVYQLGTVGRVIFATGIGAIPGGIKETALDSKFDAGDMTFNVLGALSGALASEAINGLFGPSRNARWLAVAADDKQITLVYQGRF